MEKGFNNAINNPTSESFKEQEQRIWEQEELTDRFEILPDEEALEILLENRFNQLRENYYLNFKRQIYDYDEEVIIPDSSFTHEEKLYLIKSSRFSKRNRIPLTENSEDSDISIDRKTGIILIPCWKREKTKTGESKDPKKVPYYFIVLDLPKAIRMQDHILEEKYGLVLNNPHPQETEIERLLTINKLLEEIRERFWDLRELPKSSKESDEKIVLLNEIIDLSNKVRTLLSEKGYTNLLRNEFKKEIEEILDEFNYNLNSFLDSKKRYNPQSKALKIIKVANLAKKRINTLIDKIAPKIITRKQKLIAAKIIQDNIKNDFIELLTKKLEEEVMPELRTIYSPEESLEDLKTNFDDQEAEQAWVEEADNNLVNPKKINEKKLSQLIKKLDSFFVYKPSTDKKNENVSVLGSKLNIVPYSQFRREILVSLETAKKELKKRNIREAEKNIQKAFELLDAFKHLDEIFEKKEN